MADVLLDAMQGILICLDQSHVIIDVSKTVKQFFGFEQVRLARRSKGTFALLVSLSSQTEIMGLPILLLVADSERDTFKKFLNGPSQSKPHRFTTCHPQPRVLLAFGICSVRMMAAISNNYRQVNVHRKRKLNQDNIGKSETDVFQLTSYVGADVHSTTNKSSETIGTILVLTLDDCSYIDISLFDINKQEFYTKMDLTSEIIFEDHRYAAA